MIPYWFTLPAVSAIVAGGCILLRGNLRRFHKYLAFSLVFDGLFMMLSGIVFHSLAVFYLPIHLLYELMMLVCPFLYYFAVRYLLREDGVSLRDFWMLEIIGVFAVIFVAICHNVPQVEQNLYFQMLSGRIPVAANPPTGVKVMFAMGDLGYVFFILEMLLIQLFCFVNLYRYHKVLGQYYSNTEGKSSLEIAVIFSLVALRIVIYFLTGFADFLDDCTWFRIASTVSFVVFFGVIAWSATRITFTAEELGKAIQGQESRQNAPVADELITARMTSLEAERFYTDPQISLMTIAARVQVNTKYLAEYLRFHYGETFLTYANRLRIEYSIELMKDPGLALADVSERAGFITVSTYYRNFLKVKGVSPSEYRKKMIRDIAKSGI